MASYKTVIRKLLNRTLSPLGLAVGRKDQLRHGHANSYERLHNLKTIGFAPKFVLDCGAYVGTWTLETARIFPDAKFLLVEPNTAVFNRLRETISPIASRCTVLDAAVGERMDTAKLNVWDGSATASSLLNNVAGPPQKQITVQVRT